VIEFALLFGLGFLSAALLIMLVAPAVHSRVVRYTENRIKATLPISPQEVRAQRDMARAVYAAENARTKQELVQEREKGVALQLRADQLSEEAKRLHSEAAELRNQIDNLDLEAAEARARLRQEDSYIQQLKAALEESEETLAAKEQEIEGLRQRQSMLMSEADNFRIDLSTRDTEMENLKIRLSGLRDEREALRNDLRLQTTRAKDAETRLSQEVERAKRLEEKLNREISERADRETALERRQKEILRLREKLKANGSAAKGGGNTASPAEIKISKTKTKASPQAVELRELPHASAPEEALIATAAETKPRIAEIVEDTRNRATALAERIYRADGSNDAAIRQELASIAANMVAVTAASEGPASPIHAILSGKSGNGKRESLAAKSKKALAEVQDAAG
jgi:chromosome segregation ATPase